MIWPRFRYLGRNLSNFFVVFFGKFKTSKSHFKINWPLNRTASWTRRDCQKWNYGLNFIIFKKKNTSIYEKQRNQLILHFTGVKWSSFGSQQLWPCAAVKEKKRFWLKLSELNSQYFWKWTNTYTVNKIGWLKGNTL